VNDPVLLRTSERNDFKIPLARTSRYEGDDQGNARNHRAKLMQRYRMTAEEFNDLYDKQQGQCAICKENFKKRPHVDHCHDFDVVRGLLCGPCNMRLGWYEKNQEAIDAYLAA
jgi:hypothetical protein